jgi:hypothetical protein
MRFCMKDFCVRVGRRLTFLIALAARVYFLCGDKEDLNIVKALGAGITAEMQVC